MMFVRPKAAYVRRSNKFIKRWGYIFLWALRARVRGGRKVYVGKVHCFFWFPIKSSLGLFPHGRTMILNAKVVLGDISALLSSVACIQASVKSCPVAIGNLGDFRNAEQFPVHQKELSVWIAASKNLLKVRLGRWGSHRPNFIAQRRFGVEGLFRSAFLLHTFQTTHPSVVLFTKYF